MGLFLCPKCDLQHIGTPCKEEDIIAHVEQLKREKWEAEQKLDQIRNAIFMIIQELPSLEGEIKVNKDWLDRLWKAGQCQWYEAKTTETFLVRWCALHFLLSDTYDLFRKNRYGKELSFLDKLKKLKKQVDRSQEVMGYQDSKLDYEPEDLV